MTAIALFIELIPFQKCLHYFRMGRHQDAVEAYREAYPAFNSYIECMSRAFLTSVSSFAIGKFIESLTSDF